MGKITVEKVFWSEDEIQDMYQSNNNFIETDERRENDQKFQDFSAFLKVLIEIRKALVDIRDTLNETR